VLGGQQKRLESESGRYVSFTCLMYLETYADLFCYVQINAYTLIADTEAKTEGLVRVRFEQAALCAPCVFLIRHIEALVRPGQGGKGEKFLCA
jgi:hypothetical protein